MAEPFSDEDMQGRMLALMYQPVMLGDQLLGHVTEVRPILNNEFYTGRFTVFVEGDDPFMPRQILDSVHLPMLRPRS